MILNDLILELKQKDIRLFLHQGNLRCKAPPLALTPALKVTLQSHKAELIEYIQKAQFKESASPLTVNRCGNLPLSFAQLQLWVLAQFDLQSAFYNIPGVLQLRGNLDVAALKRSLAEIVSRHEALRTTIEMVEGEAFQRILPEIDVDVCVVDWSNLPDELRTEKIQDYIEEDVQKPFDLTQGPLLRATLISTGTPLPLNVPEYILLFTVHHIVSDGWSTEILIQEFVAIYEAFRAEHPSPLPVLPFQYADYAIWQRNSLQEGKLDKHLEYWKKHLAGVPALLELPTDRPRPAVQSHRGARICSTVSESITRQLKALNQREDTTLFMVLLAAFSVLLARHSGQRDFCIGTPTANRNRTEFERLIGYFVNMLALRINLADDPSFTEFLSSVKVACIEGQAHQDLPFEKLVEALDPARDMSHSPIFQVVFTLQNASLTTLKLPGLEITQMETGTRSAKFDLFMHIKEHETTLDVELEYRTDLFEEDTINRMVEHFQVLLAAIVATPQSRLSELPILTEFEHQQLLEWNTIESQDLPRQCIHQLFEMQAKRAPNTIAVVFEDQQLTYAQLNKKANQLAHYLCSHGVGPEVLVGICIERSLEMVIGILAILKAGGAYVPIDPSYPKERIAFTVKDARIQLLLSHEACSGHLPEGLSQVIYLDRDWLVIEQQPHTNCISNCQPENLAYVIYTSGSTGEPKGTLTTHHNVLRLFEATKNNFVFCEKDVWTLYHSFAFDFSVWEIWGALLYGGKLIVVPYWVSRSPDKFYSLLCEQAVTVLNQTPSAFRLLTQTATSPDQTVQHVLRLIIFGGEALELQQLNPWFQRYGYDRTQLVNMYGITETTVHVTHCPLYDDWFPEMSGSPIGRPIKDLQAYILDEYLNLQPVGVPGELYIGGCGLARGYLDRYKLVAQRFIPNPFNDKLGARLYRTGDLACYRPDSTIEYLGRIDHQVKIRGFRIELGEIEAAILQHAEIREAVVMVRSDRTETDQLVAYLVSNDSIQDIEDIQIYLKVRLPEYMVPAAFVYLDELPLTPNGKVDRNRLPAPDFCGQLERQYVAPRNQTEEILISIWAKVLPVAQIGIDDNFFALGGDSIRSVQIISLAKERRLLITLEQLYRCGTIRHLSQTIEKSYSYEFVTEPPKPFSLISIEDQARLPEDVVDAFPLTSLQTGMIFHSEQDPGAYLVLDSLTLQCSFDLQHLQDALAQVFSNHPVLRTTFDFGNYSEPLQLIHQDYIVSLVFEDLQHLSPSQQSGLIAEWLETEKSRNFKVSELPLIRFHVHQLEHDKFQLTIAEHHAILDGWSLVSLLNETFQYYLSLIKGESITKGFVLDNAMSSVVVQERAALESSQHKTYWEHQLSNSKISLLPRLTPVVDQANSQHDGRLKSEKTLSPILSQKLLKLAKSLTIPLKNVLLAAHMRALSFLCNEQEVTSGLICSNRPEELNGDRALGVFLNTLPFCLKLKGGTWTELITQTFEAECELLKVRDYPMAALQRMWGDEPLFDVMFNYVHYRVGESLLKSEEVKIIDWHDTTQPNFSLEVSFGLDVLSAEIQLSLQGNGVDSSQLERIHNYYVAILSRLADEPTARYETQSFLNIQEQDQLLLDWNDTVVEYYTQDNCIHQLFEAQVKRNPETIAVVFEDQQLTYAVLNTRANQLAHYLRARGIGPEMLVGICIERSLEMLIGILGILKAGGAYVPIDPNYPKDRIAFMIEDAQPIAVLIHGATCGIVPDALAINMDAEREAIEQCREENLTRHSFAQNLVYVIYTSGSTGRPKGTGLAHQGVVNCLEWMQQQYLLHSNDRMLQKTPLSFDVSVLEIFCPLLEGASLIIAPPDAHKDGMHIVEIIKRHEITTLHFVPSMLSAFLDVPDVAFCESIKHVICIGEVLPDSLQRRFYDKLQAQLSNLYGPTEASIIVTSWNCERDNAGTIVPIGRPIANSQVYLLDTCLNPVPVGVAGELYIGGVGLARGYHNQGALTAEQFIPNPFSQQAGDRLYRTGDVARYRADGNIEYLNRTDHQVKIRGFRIELGEIEAVLEQLPQIKEAVVLMREDSPNNQQLVAYVVGKPLPDVVDIRTHLKERLPVHMLPFAYVFLDGLPLTSNGKIDRKRLPVPDVSGQIEHQYVAPRNPTEEILANIWAEVLGIERVGVHDNFFELGGHSLLIMQVATRTRLMFDIDLPLTYLFTTPTIEELALVVEKIVMAEIETLSETEAEAEAAYISQQPYKQVGDSHERLQ